MHNALMPLCNHYITIKTQSSVILCILSNKVILPNYTIPSSNTEDMVQERLRHIFRPQHIFSKMKKNPNSENDLNHSSIMVHNRWSCLAVPGWLYFYFFFSVFIDCTLLYDSLAPFVIIFHLHFSFCLSPLSPSSTGSPPPSRLDICCLATHAPIRASGLSSPLQWNQP